LAIAAVPRIFRAGDFCETKKIRDSDVDQPEFGFAGNRAAKYLNCP